ncbi:unnamed protein product [Lactuca saligna]|uniref:Uncharacterized protein n=1 Tax=Lactuca saligna TaxID=75948 RepID=A0AA36EED7_LACSI|nr:unnamed protein product [Lactuca saligna]
MIASSSIGPLLVMVGVVVGVPAWGALALTSHIVGRDNYRKLGNTGFQGRCSCGVPKGIVSGGSRGSTPRGIGMSPVVWSRCRLPSGICINLDLFSYSVHGLSIACVPRLLSLASIGYLALAAIRNRCNPVIGYVGLPAVGIRSLASIGYVAPDAIDVRYVVSISCLATAAIVVRYVASIGSLTHVAIVVRYVASIGSLAHVAIGFRSFVSVPLLSLLSHSLTPQ